MEQTISTNEAIVTLPWDLLHDSPLQYRKTYRDETIAEIAATIIDTGRIHQPLVVRQHFPNPLFRDQYDPQDGYEIVFGHTRKRAGMAAGLTGAPCVIRDLNDAQVRAAQAAENIARSDVHPIEEAAGFRVMIDEDGISADELAEQLGKSKSYVYARLKLLALCPEVRQAVMSGVIGTEEGLLIARVGNHKVQAKALGYIKAKYYDLKDGGKKSFRLIRDLLNERFTLDLASAIFDIDDEMLVPSAGYCGRCPKRTGNAPEFDDIVGAEKEPYSRRTAGADVCTDPDCFDAKKKAHLAREASKLVSIGKTVVAGNAARAVIGADGVVKGAYIAVKDVKAQLAEVKKEAKAGRLVRAPAEFTIQDPRTGKVVQAVKRADLEYAGVQVPDAPKQRSSYGETPEQTAKRAAEREKAEKHQEEENQRRRALLDQVRVRTRAAERSAFDLQLVAQAALSGVPYDDKPLLAELWGVKDEDDLDDHLAKLSLPDLTQFVLDCALVKKAFLQYHWDTGVPEALNAAAAHYGVNEPAPTPSTAALARGRGAKSAKAKKGPLKISDADAPDKPELALGDQMDDAGSAGGSDAQAEALEEAGA